ncbi:MAG: ATP-dependent helicase HrpB [Deltaproteobacteria bacterium]|nr:ATP-dependent helicase HrpB [Deltaproteobacteria bacterium]
MTDEKRALTPLPIDAVVPELKSALAGFGAAVLQAEPGAGKTTRVPLSLLDEPWLAGRSILMLEPRRLAAVNAARYMASLLGEEAGQRIGYAIRFERRGSSRTRIEVVTEGILTRRLQHDPALEGVGLVIFDEFHERHLESDLALALCLDVRSGLRSELRLLVMSATLDSEPVARLLGGAPLVTSRGRSYPVEFRYLGADPAVAVAERVAVAVRRALRETEGDILAFLPGGAEIRRCQGLLEQGAGAGTEILPLYGELPFAEQQRAILPGNKRRVVLATNIAETSLTIEGVRVVVDGGLARRPRFDAASGLSRLETARISRASAEQRAGRAGRVAPGVCYRLWSEGDHGGLLPFTPPEIRSADLAGLALELACWGACDAAALAWLDPPSPGALAGGRQLLEWLGALDLRGRITPLGEQMARLPTHPRLARLLVAAAHGGVPALGCDLAALLGEGRLTRDSAGAGFRSRNDLLDRVAELKRRSGGDAASGALFERAVRFWRQRLGVTGGEERPAPEVAARLLALAYPDRIGRERRPGSRDYLLSGGQGATLSRCSGLRDEPWLVAVEVAGAERGEGEIRAAAALTQADVEELFAGRLLRRREVAWDKSLERVTAQETLRLGAVVVESRPLRATDQELAEALLGAIRREGLAGLTWSAEAVRLSARVRFAAGHFPDEDWPDFRAEALLATVADWLGPALAGVRSKAELARLDLAALLRARLSWRQLQRLEQVAPTHLTVPSGSRLPLDYEPEGGPVLSVKLQELFGLAETPRVAAGKVAVLLHLLSPAARPIQVTRDLANFWERVYPEVKKELKGRYPKHPWPDDPWHAEPTRGTKRKPG